MSTKSAKKKLMLVIVVATLLLAVLLARSGNYAQAQDEKKITLKDALTRVSPNTVRANTGFILEKTGEREFTVRRATTRVEIGRVSCSVCPGGRCTGTARDGIQAKCEGCGSDRDCVLDPF